MSAQSSIRHKTTVALAAIALLFGLSSCDAPDVDDDIVPQQNTSENGGANNRDDDADDRNDDADDRNDDVNDDMDDGPGDDDADDNDDGPDDDNDDGPDD